MGNTLSGLLGGNIKGDVAVNVVIDPGSIVLLAVMILLAIVMARLAVKVIK